MLMQCILLLYIKYINKIHLYINYTYKIMNKLYIILITMTLGIYLYYYN